MKALYWKELRQLFHSMIGYAYLTAFAVICGYYFLTVNLLPGSGDIRPYFLSLFTILLFLLPMITMRSFAEERKSGTAILLIASPLGASQIIAGKFLALFTFFLFSLLPCLLHLAVLGSLGIFERSLILCNLTGLCLSGACFLSVGIFLSTVTENQVVACVATYCALLLFFLIGYASSYASLPALQELCEALSLQNRFYHFSMGILSFSDIAFFLSTALGMLCLASITVAHLRD